MGMSTPDESQDNNNNPNLIETIQQPTTNKFQKNLIKNLISQNISKLFIIKNMDFVKRVCLNNNIHQHIINSTALNSANILAFIRRAIHANAKQLKTIYEGEVVGIKLSNYNYELTLKSKRGLNNVVCNEKMYSYINDLNLRIGHVVYIEPEQEIIKIIGCTDESIIDSKFTPIPNCEVKRQRLIKHDLSLRDLDIVNNKNHGNNMWDKIKKTNHDISRGVERGLTTINIGILHITNAEYIDKNVVNIINNFNEKEEYCPIIIFDTVVPNNESMILLDVEDEHMDLDVKNSSMRPVLDAIRKEHGEECAKELKLMN